VAFPNSGRPISAPELPAATATVPLLSEIAPGLKRAAIMFNPDTAPHRLIYPHLRRRLGMEINVIGQSELTLQVKEFQIKVEFYHRCDAYRHGLDRE
jgi:hypothetical protein